MDKSGKFQDEWGRSKARERYDAGGEVKPIPIDSPAGMRFPPAPRDFAARMASARTTSREAVRQERDSPDRKASGGRLDKRARGGAIKKKADGGSVAEKPKEDESTFAAGSSFLSKDAPRSVRKLIGGK